MYFLYLSIPDPQREGHSLSHVRVSWLSSFLPPLFSFPFFHIFTLFLVVVVGTTEVYSFGKSQVCNTLLLTRLTMLYIKFPELIHLITESLCPLTYMSFPPHPAPDNHSSTYCFCECDLFRFHTYIPHSMCLAPSRLFHWALYSQGLSILLRITGIPSFLWLNGIALYSHTTF